MGPNDIGVINKYVPNLLFKGIRIKGLGFKRLHEEVGYYRGEGGPCGYTTENVK